jgi:hypothetical protein
MLTPNAAQRGEHNLSHTYKYITLVKWAISKNCPGKRKTESPGVGVESFGGDAGLQDLRASRSPGQ